MTNLLPDSLVSSPDSPLENRSAAQMGIETHAIGNVVDGTFNQSYDCSTRHDIPEWQAWPGDLSDPMSWSAQFIDPSQSVYFSGAQIAGVETSMYAPVVEDT